MSGASHSVPAVPGAVLGFGVFSAFCSCFCSSRFPSCVSRNSDADRVLDLLRERCISRRRLLPRLRVRCFFRPRWRRLEWLRSEWLRDDVLDDRERRPERDRRPAALGERERRRDPLEERDHRRSERDRRGAALGERDLRRTERDRRGDALGERVRRRAALGERGDLGPFGLSFDAGVEAIESVRALPGEAAL